MYGACKVETEEERRGLVGGGRPYIYWAGGTWGCALQPSTNQRKALWHYEVSSWDSKKSMRSPQFRPCGCIQGKLHRYKKRKLKTPIPKANYAELSTLQYESRWMARLDQGQGGAQVELWSLIKPALLPEEELAIGVELSKEKEVCSLHMDSVDSQHAGADVQSL
ncbi:hypothetical protein BDZ45DRAFT_738466 [Acephala macrosclerotiorum]|nr:hypothetical protein BDZ45DRAFT_738466 [Acephala macrosclerotiorum]